MLALVGFAVAPSAAAEDAAAAYQAGLDAMLAGKYEVACPKLAQSYAAEPLAGALFTLAACYERWGKVHSAVQRYEAFLADQGNRDIAELPADQRKKAEERMTTALDKVRALEPQVPTLTLRLSSPDAAADVRVDDGSVELGAPIKLDPGEHRVTWTAAPGSGAAKLEKVTLEMGQHQSLTLDVTAPVMAPPEEPADMEQGGARDGMMVGAIVAAGVGVTGIVIGSVTGVLTFGKKDDVDEWCRDAVCTPAGKAAADDGQRLALISTVGFAAGGAGLAAAALLFFLAPDEASDEIAWRAGAGLDGGFIGVGGRF